MRSTKHLTTKYRPIEEQLTPASCECAQPVHPIGIRDRGQEMSDVSFPVHNRPVNKIGDTL